MLTYHDLILTWPVALIVRKRFWSFASVSDHHDYELELIISGIELTSAGNGKSPICMPSPADSDAAYRWVVEKEKKSNDCHD